MTLFSVHVTVVYSHCNLYGDDALIFYTRYAGVILFSISCEAYIFSKCRCVVFRSYIASRATDKITPITDRMVVCRSGSAADTQAISDIVKYYIEVYS